MKKEYELSENIKYKMLNVDFNEHSFNKYNNDNKLFIYNIKTGPNCVKRKNK